MKQYNLIINEKQAQVIKIALEEYFRIRMGQTSDLAESLASTGFIYNKEDPENTNKFNEYLKRRDETQLLLNHAIRVSQPVKVWPLPDECLIMEDIWQVIRQQLYLDRGGDPDGMSVEARNPLQVSQEPLPKMEKI